MLGVAGGFVCWCQERTFLRSSISARFSGRGIVDLMFSHSVYLAVSSIPDWSVSAFPHGRIFPSFILHTWIVAVGESRGEVLSSQGPLKRLSLSAVLRSSLDDVISISVFAGDWLWASLKFLALSSSSFWRISAASFVFRVIAL